MLAGQLDCINSLGKGSDLVHLDKYRICRTFIYPPLQPFYVCNKQVVSNQLDFIPYGLVELIPSLPVILIHSIFYGDDGVFSNPFLPVGHHLGGGHLLAG